MTVHAWSVFEEIIRYLKNMEIVNKKCVLQEHLSAMAPTVGKRMYSQELIVISVFCNIQELVQSTTNRLSITVHQKIDQNNIESISFKGNMFYA